VAMGLDIGVSMLVNVVPRNPVDAMARFDLLAVIFFALMFGVGLTRLAREKAGPMIRVLEALGEVMTAIIELAMRLAPLGVAALMFTVTARFGFDLLMKLGLYVATVILGLSIHMFVVYPFLVRVLGGMRPSRFFRGARTILLTAFSTSSSNATLPTTLRVTERELGVPREICGFVLPLGATLNMNGTALFEGVTVLFLAQVFGARIDLGGQAVLLVLCVITAVGAAGTPSSSIPLLVLILQSLGLPGEGIAIVIGVDRLLDMCRTTLNVAGDVTAALYVTRAEGLPLRPADGGQGSVTQG
jgi:DAACS family dicarboxylate/amino acid:cation (Na+ or H+) symporter